MGKETEEGLGRGCGARRGASGELGAADGGCGAPRGARGGSEHLDRGCGALPGGREAPGGGAGHGRGDWRAPAAGVGQRRGLGGGGPAAGIGGAGRGEGAGPGVSPVREPGRAGRGAGCAEAERKGQRGFPRYLHQHRRSGGSQGPGPGSPLRTWPRRSLRGWAGQGWAPRGAAQGRARGAPWRHRGRSDLRIRGPLRCAEPCAERGPARCARRCPARCSRGRPAFHSQKTSGPGRAPPPSTPPLPRIGWDGYRGALPGGERAHPAPHGDPRPVPCGNGSCCGPQSCCGTLVLSLNLPGRGLWRVPLNIP